MLHPHSVRAYDIRGTVGIHLSEQSAFFLGQQFGRYLRNESQGIPQTVAVGYDGRTSSPSLVQELINGLTQEGISVINIGMVPTPLVYFAVQTLSCDAGIAVTGSHNPPQDNGFKITLKDRPFYGDDLQNLQKVSQLFPPSENGTVQSIAVESSYKQWLKQLVPSPLPLKIVWDTGHGVVGKMIHEIAEMACEQSIFLYPEVDGRFPAHAPNPSDHCAMQDLQKAVLDHQFDLGVGFDGDGDRLGIVDSKGRLLGGDQLLAILARDVLTRCPGAVILSDIKTSRGIIDFVTRYGGQIELCPSGHSKVKEAMKQKKALLAGEVSGHFFLGEEYFGFDDGIYALFRLLRFLSASNQSIDDLLDGLPSLVTTPEYRMHYPEETKFQRINDIQNQLMADQVSFNAIDGIRVDLEKGWWLLRASNTEAAISIRLEALTSNDFPMIKNHLLQYFPEAQSILMA